MRRAAGVSLIFGALLAAGLIWLVAPHVDTEEVRLDELASLSVAYSNETADPLCTKLYEITDGRASDRPVFPRVAADLDDPNQDATLKEGDRLVVRGYRYLWRERNRITGNESLRPTGRIDVVAWRGPSGKDFVSKLDPALRQNFPVENYVGCR